MVNQFKAGDVVEALDVDTRKWRPATIERVAPHGRHEGYYITWTLPADSPSWVSRGGWKPSYSVRQPDLDARREERLRDEGIIGGRYSDDEPAHQTACHECGARWTVGHRCGEARP